jgi:hypothetical protein
LVKLPQLTIKSFASVFLAMDFREVMNGTRMFEAYAERAKAATCATCRTVNMLGMMCAAAIDNRGFLAFVGRGYGGDWPDPRETTEPPRDTGSRPHLSR